MTSRKQWNSLESAIAINKYIFRCRERIATMKLALLRTVGNSVRHPASYPSTRALHTAPVVMRQTRVQAMGGESDKRDSSNLPARPSAPESGLSLFGPRSFLSPFSALRQMEQEMDSLMRGFGLPALETALAPQGAMSLAVDVQDKGDHYEIAADVPGLSREDIKVSALLEPSGRLA